MRVVWLCPGRGMTHLQVCQESTAAPTDTPHHSRPKHPVLRRTTGMSTTGMESKHSNLESLIVPGMQGSARGARGSIWYIDVKVHAVRYSCAGGAGGAGIFRNLQDSAGICRNMVESAEMWCRSCREVEV